MYIHHLMSTVKAMKKRIGRMVNVWSQASKHARAPKYNVRSRKAGKRSTFKSRSSLTALDSYGISLAWDWWM
jgi:hypothetical protein